MKTCFVGVDLSGSPRRLTGLSFVDDSGRITSIVAIYGRVEKIAGTILALCGVSKGVVAIDSPLLGHTENTTGFREVDRVLLRKGFKLLPLGNPGMRLLVKRASKLSSILEKNGFEVIETHPRSSILSAGCTWEEWYTCIGRYVKIDASLKNLCVKDLVDAVIASTVAFLHGDNRDLEVRASDGVIHLLPPFYQGNV